MTKVSILMPVYNGEKYLAEAIDSILGQTHQDWELVIVNDGSIDHTADIIVKYLDARIIVYNQENEGEGAARNSALERATGEYIAFLDADDLFTPTAIESNARHLDYHPEVMVVYSDGYYCDHSGKPIRQFSDLRQENYEGRVLWELAVSPFPCASCSVVVRKSAIDSIKLRFSPELYIGTDWNFLLELARYFDFGYNPKITCKYRVHGGNVTVTYSEKRAEQLGKARMRILTLPEYLTFSSDQQYKLIYQLLFDTYQNNFEKQQEVLHCEQTLLLPKLHQAKLSRLVGSHWIKKGGIPRQSVQEYYSNALSLNPKDLKARLLYYSCRWCFKGLRFYFRMKMVKNETRIFDFG